MKKFIAELKAVPVMKRLAAFLLAAMLVFEVAAVPVFALAEDIKGENQETEEITEEPQEKKEKPFMNFLGNLFSGWTDTSEDKNEVSTKAIIVYGDVDRNQKVNVLDANLIRRYAAKMSELDSEQFKAAEVDGNGKVNVLDANLVRRFAAKLVTRFPAEDLATTFTVNFKTEGGTSFDSKEVEPGTKISSFPTPYKENCIFEGWFYDAEKTVPVGSDDTVEEDITLYASYMEMSPLEVIESKKFASAIDVAKNFAITVVTEDKDIDAAAVLAGIEAENLSNPDQKDFISVTGVNGTFVIRGNNPISESSRMAVESGFEEGASFRITLKDGRLNFKDEPETVREYNFTTAKEEALNLKYDEDIIYISASDLSNITKGGERVESLSIPLYSINTEGEVDIGELDKGTFVYTKATLKVGDVVTVYEGVRPDLRTLDTPLEDCGDVAYIEITGKLGNTYHYQKAEAEDIIFEPDMLPIPVDADTDEDENTVTVENKYLDYSADAFANIELDSQTTVDPGDFLVFYTGIFGTESGEDAANLTGIYGEVVKVSDNGDGTTTITYSGTTWDNVQSAMDVYTNEELSGEDLLEGVDVEALEAEIEKQARESGFAEEAAEYLASLALATENFTKLSENMNLQDYKIELSDGTPISPEELQLMDSSVKAEFELEKIKPTVGIHPSHLDDYSGKGLVVGLEVEGTLTISKKGSENTIEITISGNFLEELSIDIGTSHKAIWDVWGIFPYISEYRVTSNVDLLNYTGIEVNATMVTKEGEDEEEEGEEGEEGEDIAEFIKGLLEKAAEEGEDEEDEDEDVDGSNLVKHYSEMLEEEADFLKIVDAQMFEKKVYCSAEIPIICVEFQADFIVEMEACVSIGFDFEYKTGKRYVFNIDVFDMKATSKTITLIEESYEFCFYAMGRLGIRAGIELTFKIGLFDTSTNSIGVTAGAGAYVKLWGYFYYELTYSESEGKNQSYCGALLIEVGAFLEMGLEAQVLEGTLKKEWEVLDMEWPLYHVGNADNVLDFTNTQEDMPDIKLKQYIRSIVIPDDVFLLHYLDLQEGEEMDAVYEDYFDPSKPASEKNRENFTFKFTNDKFSYDPQTNTISVNPASGDEKLEGEMIITWNQYPLAFSSKPIQRKISLYWDNLRDGYVIVPYTNGGTYIPIIEARFEEKVSAPAAPEKIGYTFAGWYSDENYTTAYTFPESMPAADANIYAKWEPRTDITYRVEHYQQQLASGEYELFETDEFTGTTNAYVTPAVKTYTGYNSPAKQEVRILADGSAVLRYYYDLKWAKVTFEPGEIGGEAISYDLKYGAKIAAPQMAAKGYTFTGWDKEVVPFMGTENVTYTAQWKKNPDTAYRVEYYVQQVDGRYTLQHLIEAEGFTGDTLTAKELRSLVVDGENNLTADEKYIAKDAFEFDKMTVKGMSCETAEIDGSGKTIIKINYKRIAHHVTFDFGYNDKSVSNEVCYEGAIPVPKAERTGYEFLGWSIDGETIVEPEEKMGLSDLEYVALWEAHTYTVKFDKNSEDATGNMEDIVLTYDKEEALPENAFELENYEFEGWGTHSDGAVEFKDAEKVLNLTAEKEAVVTLYAHWKAKGFEITYHGCEEAVNPNPVTYTIESETIVLADAVKDGYIFEGWYDNASYSGSRITVIEKGTSGDLDLYAKWEPRTDIPYRVEHYQETADGSWVLKDTDELEGSVDTAIYPAVKSYEHYDAPVPKEVYISIDGTTVVRYEYTRKYYTINLDANGGTLPEGAETSITAKHGTPISLPAPVKEGHGFDGWYYNGAPFTEKVMPTKNITLTAHYTAGLYGYTINHYQQNVDGNGYTLVDSVHGTAEIDSEITGAHNYYKGFSAPSDWKTITIGMDENANVINYYYTRNQYNLSWNLGGGTASGSYTSGKVYYGAAIVAPVPVKAGHSYKWNETPAAVMPAEDLEYTAIWTANKYSVVFDLDGGKVVSGSAATREVTFGSAYGELPVLEKQAYHFDGWYTAKEGGAKVTAETIVTNASNHTLYARYTAETYAITYNGVEGATNDNPATYGAATGNVTLKAPVKEGYTFEGWYLNADFSGTEVKTVAKDRGEDLVLFAKWSENKYTVIFHSNNGSGEATSSEEFTYTEEKALNKNTFTRMGYTFLGWAENKAATKAEYTDGQVVSKLTAEANGEVHLYAVWAPKEYKIVYMNLEGATNAKDNPASFNAENNVITLHDPSKTGYTFAGWFTDSDFEHKVSGTITLEASHDWIFYAKWTPNQYVITFDSCLGDSVPRESMLMTYDVAANLTLVSEMVHFSNPGYTFKGWATEKGGKVSYRDGESVINLVTEGGITLYAVWELNSFTITYDLGAGGISHNNPTSYTFEDDDVAINAPVAKEGYKFLGWYEGENLITEIVKGTQKDFNLVAKWAHGGFFTIAHTGNDEIENGTKRIFTVIRTLPEGTEPLSNPQHVYYRTLNYTAYGSTVDVEQGGQHDKYHFLHVGGPDVYLVFGPNDTEMTFSVTEWGIETTGDMAAAFANKNVDKRSYFVELYDVIDTVGGYDGSIDAENKRINISIEPLANGKGILTTDPYQWFGGVIDDWENTVTDDGYDENPIVFINVNRHFTDKFGANEYLLGYINQTAGGLGMYTTMDIYEENDGYQWARFVQNGGGILAEYSWETKSGSADDTWRKGMHLPTTGSSQFGGVVEFPKSSKYPCTNYWTLKSETINGSTVHYALVDPTREIYVEFDASGSLDDDWYFTNFASYYKVADTVAPQQVGVAPMAFGTYHKGDTVFITVNYDEVINFIDVSSATLGNIAGLNLEEAMYIYGAGSNALVFMARVSEDFEITPDINNTLVNTRPVTATVYDIVENHN
ncbi:MAG: InlB B-repeat-containing protein [Oscillospiraceae bacterium]|nr:InlB B-repeat-containing protein [Oscillospiraceae bacterium]